MTIMKLLKLHQILPTVGNDYKEHEVIINIEKMSYFYPTLDGKYTMIMFDHDNRLMVSEPFEKIEELTSHAREIQW